jgi:Kef-type K+ transport system membrane component KefB
MTSNCGWTSRLTRPYVLWGIASLTVQWVADWLFKHEELRLPARSILAFLPALMAIFMVVAILQDVRKLDEMVRRIHLQAASTAFLLTVILTFVFDGLESAGIYRATRGALVTANLVIWVAALICFNWRYR